MCNLPKQEQKPLKYRAEKAKTEIKKVKKIKKIRE